VRTAVADVVALSGATLIVVEHRVSIWSGYVDRVIALDGDGGLLADGTPDSVFGAHAARLRDAGVWLPHDDEARSSVDRRHPTTPASGRTLITAHKVSVGRSRGNPVVTELDISVSEASATAISGRNGVGKSTLALTLGGLIPPAGGAVVASDSLAAGAGTSPITWTSAQLLTRIGSVFQSPEHQFLASTVRKELAVGPRALRRPAAMIDDRVDELLVRLRLDGLADANPFTLSGGQKRRLSVATALATMPKLLIFDEPTFGQDARTWRELIEIFHELVSVGHAIVAVTHDSDFVEALGARELTISAEGLSQHQYSAGSRDVGS
jgi:energy-coupling factor transporter ATP-binding protein EcfA2